MRKVPLLSAFLAIPLLAFAQNVLVETPAARPGEASSPARQLLDSGLAAEKGDGRKQSYTDARRLYEQSAALGSAEASLHLGRLYLEGWGVPRDPARAAAFIETAANAGLHSAQRMLCDMYLLGIGVTRDPVIARQWAEKAAAQDDPAAEVKLGQFIERGHPGVSRDPNLARQWYQLSAEQDYTQAMNAMAQSFLRPGASDLDREFAARWLELAVEGGNPTAAYVLAVLCVARAPDDSASLTRAKELLLQSKNARRGLASSDAAAVLKKHDEGASLLDAFRYVLGTPRPQRSADARQERLARWDNASRVPPRAINSPPPVFPESVRLKQLKGTVVLQYVVTKAGFAEDIQVLSSDHPALTEVAIERVRKTRFLPALKNGERIAQKVSQSYRLSYEDTELDVSRLHDALPEEISGRPEKSPAAPRP